MGWSGRGVGGSNFSYICTRVKHNTSPCHSLSNHSRCCENPVQAEALVEFCATSHWDLPTESSPSGLSSSTCLSKVLIIFLIALEKLHPLWISEAEDWIYQKAVRKQCSKETLKAKNDYVNEKVMDDLEHGNTKPFGRFIKHQQFDIISIPPIRHAGQLLTNSIEKAGVFGAEFQSVFTREDLTCIPWLDRKCNSVIPPLTITEVGVKKLLDRLKPQKASGPDRIPNCVLKE